MTNIEKHSKIRAERLSGEFYLQTLLQEALELEELSASELEGIQMQTLRLLAETVERYNRGKSSSVPLEAAQAIMESLFYTIGLALKPMPPASALDALKSGQIESLYGQGCRVMQSKLKTARHLLMLVHQTRIKTENESYNATVEGLASFFTLYNPDFEAHETPADIDYQLANTVVDLAGVEYMVNYLESLYMENLFCANFDSTALHEIMLGYDTGYKDLLVNLFCQALQNALGHALLGKDIAALRIDSAGIEILSGMLYGQSQSNLLALLQQEAKKVMQVLMIDNIDLKKYVFATLPELSARLHSAVEQDALHLFFPPRVPEKQKTVQYSMGKKMEDEEYRTILSEIASCRHPEDKIRIIKETIHSLADMEDLLLDGELSESETYTVLDWLGDMEIAVLLNRHPCLPVPELADPCETEVVFLLRFEKYLQSMPTERLKKLQDSAADIEIN